MPHGTNSDSGHKGDFKQRPTGHHGIVFESEPSKARCYNTPILTVAMSSSNYHSNRWDIVKMLAEAEDAETAKNG